MSAANTPSNKSPTLATPADRESVGRGHYRHQKDGSPQPAALEAPSFLDIPILTDVIDETDIVNSAPLKATKI